MKRSLQIVVALLSLLPLTFGTLGIVFGIERFVPQGPINPNLDSQFRFMSAWYVALSAIAWWILPTIERHTALFRILCVAVFCGGLARLLAWSAHGAPDMRFLVVLTAELLFPLLMPWQALVARRFGNTHGERSA